MPGKPATFLSRDLEIRAAMSGPQGQTVNISTHRNDTDPHPAWDAVQDAECQESAILDDDNIPQQVLVAASEIGTVGLLVPPKYLVGSKITGGVAALTVHEALAERKFYNRYRPVLDQATIAGTGKPVIVYRGILRGFTMPVYAANQELFFAEPNLPYRWDGSSDVEIHINGYLDTANTSKRFRLQVSWEHYTLDTDVVPTTTHDVEKEILTGVWAQYQTFETVHVLDYDVDTPDNLMPHDVVAMRIRRINKTGVEDEIAGNVIITGVVMIYLCDKVGNLA